jgi:hypothetical protein
MYPGGPPMQDNFDNFNKWYMDMLNKPAEHGVTATEDGMWG